YTVGVLPIRFRGDPDFDATPLRVRRAAPRCQRVDVRLLNRLAPETRPARADGHSPRVPPHQFEHVSRYRVVGPDDLDVRCRDVRIGETPESVVDGPVGGSGALFIDHPGGDVKGPLALFARPHPEGGRHVEPLWGELPDEPLAVVDLV